MNTNMDIQNINLPDLIKNNQHNRFSPAIKNYEDTLQKLLINNKDSTITKEPFVFLWKANKDIFPYIIDNVGQLCSELFGKNEFESISQHVVITGPLVRSCLIEPIENENISIIQDLYFHKCCDEPWDQLIDITAFEDRKNEYVFENNNKKIFLLKKQYKHCAHVILQNSYLKRVGYYNGDYFVSSMFLLEIQKHLELLGSKFRDPILNIPYDPLEIYKSKEKDKMHPTKIIDMVDYEELVSLSKKYLHKLYNGKTCLELCLDKFMIEDNPVVLNQLTQMIIYIGSLGHIKRPVCLYSSFIGLHNKNEDIHNYLKRLENQYKISTDNLTLTFNSIDDINNFIVTEIIKHDNYVDLIDFLTYTKQKINKSIINLLIDHNSNIIIDQLISDKILDIHLIYYLILMSENFELTKLIDFKLDIDISMNYLKDILTKGKIRSFFYMYELDPTIVNFLFDDNKNLLHLIEPNGNYVNLTQIIIKLSPDLLNLKDSDKLTPIMHHSKFNPSIVKIILDYEFDYTLTDSDGNTFLHYLCKYNYHDVLKFALKRCPELIDMPNKNSETPIIITGFNNKENMFYVLKSMGADIKTKDLYGNTVFHYICSNSMCLGMIIEDTPNYFGLKPSDYCKISTKYYTFVSTL